MKKSGYIRYWLILLVALGLAAAYASKNRLMERYRAHLERERQITEFRTQIEAMHKRVTDSRARAEQLDINAVEKEAAVRRIKGWARPGETVYRVEETPPDQ